MSGLSDSILALAQGKRAGSAGWVRIDCPACELTIGKADRKRCMGVSALSGRWNCWRCGSAGRIPNFNPDDFDSSHYVPTDPDDGPQEIDPPEGYMALTEEPALSAEATEEAWRYLEGRGLSFELIKQAQIGVCLTGRYHGRVIVPLLGSDGAWLWWVGRSFIKRAEKPYIYPSGGRAGLLYNHQALLKKTDVPVAVVEGVFDALYLWPDAVAVLGKPNDDQIEALVSARRPVAVVLDGDAWVGGLALSMRLRFDGQIAGYCKLPATLDPDEIPRERLREEMVRCLSE